MFLGFKSNNHPQQVVKRGALDSIDDRETPPDLFILASSSYGPFTIDVAASEKNTKRDRFYTIDDNGLDQSWSGERVWCNPPFSNIKPWIVKAWQEWPSAETIVMLLPATRTEQAWWQDYVEPFRDQDETALSVRFLPGRPRFIYPHLDRVLPNQRPPFGCCLLIWSGDDCGAMPQSIDPGIQAELIFK